VCGFYGIYHPNRLGTKVEFENASKYLNFRGPDDSGVFEDNQIGGIHFRLSIIDLGEDGHQPFSSDGQTLFYNGEIYNYKELSRELSKEWNFKTNSDTEVLFAILSLGKYELINQIRGMFSFLFYNSRTRKIVLGRDHFGQKPLYWAVTSQGELIFSSMAIPVAYKIGSVLAKSPEYDLFQFCLPGTSPYPGVNEVKPGFFIIFEDDLQPKEKAYWKFKQEISDPGESFIYLFERAVKRSLVADVPIASTLSGGIDSSAIVGMAAALGSKLEAYHGRYFQSDSTDESAFAKEVANLNGVELNIIDISNSDFAVELPHALEALEYPAAGPGLVGQYIVAREISKRFKVSLSGQGGDELFLGYGKSLPVLLRDLESEWERSAFEKHLLQFRPLLEDYDAKLSRLSAKKEINSLDIACLALIRSVDFDINDYSEVIPKIESYLISKNFNWQNYSPLKIYQLLELCISLPALLQVEDRMSMRHGLETRLPFLDVDLVNFALGLPTNKLLQGGLKGFLKTELAKVLPAKVLNRTDKNGFNVPLTDCFNQNSTYEYKNMRGGKIRANAFISSSTSRAWWNSFCCWFYGIEESR
jgi:asparagine synthase (glutamine-hydrolysing)